MTPFEEGFEKEAGVKDIFRGIVRAGRSFKRHLGESVRDSYKAVSEPLAPNAKLHSKIYEGMSRGYGTVMMTPMDMAVRGYQAIRKQPVKGIKALP